MRAFLLALLVLVALPAAASAATVRVVPYPPDRCDRGLCPAENMTVVTAAPGEANDITISSEPMAGAVPVRFRVRVRDLNLTPVQAGAGCERVGMFEVTCQADLVGPVGLGDLDDRLTARESGLEVSGGAGDDVLAVGNTADGDAGDDVVIAQEGNGGPGNDLLAVKIGEGGRGNDLLRCFPQPAACRLAGGAGNDRLTGGRSVDALAGEGGRDFLDGLGGKDKLEGGPGNDRLRGGAGADQLLGGSGNDRLDARELRSLGEQTARDDVNCGPGRRDRAIADRRDKVSRCERVRRAPRRTR